MRINARAVTVTLCGFILAVVTACAKNDSTDVTANSTGSPTPAATSGAPTTPPPTTAPPTTAPPTILKTPQEAAEHLYNAWKAGDKATALLGASSAAVDALFTDPWTNKPYFFGGCSTDTECDYNYAAGVIKMTIAGNATTGYTVTAVERGSAG